MIKVECFECKSKIRQTIVRVVSTPNTEWTEWHCDSCGHGWTMTESKSSVLISGDLIQHLKEQYDRNHPSP